MYPFLVDNEYTKKDIYKIIELPPDKRGGIWDTGYNQYKNDFFIFCNIGTSGRTGHDYDNKFEGNLFHWYAKNNTTILQPQIKSLLNPSGYIYIFYRYDNSKPFTFAGTGIPYSHKNISPVQITWKITNGFDEEHHTKEEFDSFTSVIKEGSKRQNIVNIYERNPEARKKCVEIYGYKCSVCGFDFEKVYDELGKCFVHVHHIKPLSEINHDHYVNPENDLRPVCPNCHAMLHRKTPALEIETLKRMIHAHTT